MRFVRAAARLADVRLLGIVQAPPDGSDARLYADLVRVSHAYEQGRMPRISELSR